MELLNSFDVEVQVRYTSQLLRKRCTYCRRKTREKIAHRISLLIVPEFGVYHSMEESLPYHHGCHDERCVILECIKYRCWNRPTANTVGATARLLDRLEGAVQYSPAMAQEVQRLVFRYGNLATIPSRKKA